MTFECIVIINVVRDGQKTLRWYIFSMFPYLSIYIFNIHNSSIIQQKRQYTIDILVRAFIWKTKLLLLHMQKNYPCLSNVEHNNRYLQIYTLQSYLYLLITQNYRIFFSWGRIPQYILVLDYWLYRDCIISKTLKPSHVLFPDPPRKQHHSSRISL